MSVALVQSPGTADFGPGLPPPTRLPSATGKRAADRRATAKAKAKASSSAAAEAQPPDGKLPLPTKKCCPMLQKLHDAISAIKSHAIFQDITTALPLGISDGGSQAAFSQSTFDTALRASGCYTAVANFFWQNMGWFPNA